MAKDLIFKTDGTFDFGDSKSLSTRFNLAELKMGGRVAFANGGPGNFSPAGGAGTRGTKMYLVDYSFDEMIKDLNAGKLKREIAQDIYNKNPKYFDDLPSLKNAVGRPVSKVTNITTALSSRIRYHPDLVKLDLKNIKNFEKLNNTALKDIKSFAKKNAAAYKKMYESNKIGAVDSFKEKILDYASKKYPRLMIRSAGTKNLPANQRLFTPFSTLGREVTRAGEYGLEKELNKLVRKGIGIPERPLAGEGQSLDRMRRNYNKDLTKNLKRAQDLGVVPKIDPMTKSPINTEHAYYRYVDRKDIDPVRNLFGRNYKFGQEHVGGVSRAAVINDVESLNRITAMDPSVNRFVKGAGVDKKISNLMKLAKQSSGVKAKGYLKSINELLAEVDSKFGLDSPKYKLVNNEIKAVYPKADDSTFGKAKKAVKTFTATERYKDPNFKLLNTDLQKSITSLKKGDVKQSDKFLKKALKAAKGVGKYAGRTAIKLAAPFVPFLGPAAVTLGALDVKEAHARGLTKPEELGTAYYLGPTAAEGMRDITDYDYKGRAAKEFENMKESWANLGTGSGEVVDDVSEQMIGFKTGGSVEPRIPYRDGTSVAPNPPQEKSWEDTTAEWDKTLSAGGFNNDKPMYQKFGDMVDAESLALYYPALLNEAGLNVADFATRLPKVAKYLFEDVLTTPVGTGIDSLDVDNSGIHKAWTEITRPYEWSKKVPYGYGEDGIVTLDDLITNREAKMKAAGKSDWPVIAGKNIQLGAELVAPIFPGLKAATSVAKSLKNSGTQLLDSIMSQKGMNTNVIDEALTDKGMSRRDFNKIVAVGGLAAALKAAGLSDMFKVAPIKPTTAGIKILRESSTKMPAWFPQFVDKISAKMIYEGDGISKYVGTADELPGVEVTKNGENWTVAGKNEYGQDFELHYEAPGYIDAGAEGGSPVFYKGDFTANDSVPSAYVGPEDVDYDASLLTEVDEVLGGTRQLEEFATGKEVKTPTVGENRVTQAEMKAEYDYDMWREQQADDFIDE